MYIYFVSYHFNTRRQTGFGNMEVQATKKIKHISDLKEIKRVLDKNNKDEYGQHINSIVINYELLRTEKTNPRR